MQSLTLPRSQICVVLKSRITLCFKNYYFEYASWQTKYWIHKADKTEGIHIIAEGLQDKRVGRRQDSEGKENWVQALTQPLSCYYYAAGQFYPIYFSSKTGQENLPPRIIMVQCVWGQCV